jgi:hypothetical protein
MYVWIRRQYNCLHGYACNPLPTIPADEGTGPYRMTRRKYSVYLVQAETDSVIALQALKSSGLRLTLYL